MNNQFPDWINQGYGRSPEVRWAHSTDGPLTATALAKESGDFFAADKTGALCRIDQLGQIAAVSRLSSPISALAWSDSGSHGIAIQGSHGVSRFDRQLRNEWEIELDEKCLAVGIDPYANYSVVSLADSGNLVLDRHYKQVAVFETFRPIKHFQFLTEEVAIIAVAESGTVCCYDIRGRELWDERLWSNSGDIAIAEAGDRLLIASLAHGVVKFSLDGRPKGSLVIEGTVKYIATSYSGKIFFVATIEGKVFRVDIDGEVLWSAKTPEPVNSRKTP